MLAFLLWVGLSATVSLLLAAAAEDVLARAKSSRKSQPLLGAEGLISISLIRAGASRVRNPAHEISSEEKKAA